MRAALEESGDCRGPWEDLEALEMLAESLSFGQKRCVTNPHQHWMIYSSLVLGISAYLP